MTTQENEKKISAALKMPFYVNCYLNPLIALKKVQKQLKMLFFCKLFEIWYSVYKYTRSLDLRVRHSRTPH